jgi:hypothetical protein
MLIVTAMLRGSVLIAAEPATAPSDPSADRLTFLTLQLSSAEESIKAIDHALIVAGYQGSVATDKVQDYQKGNELMDRKGGAPIPWDEFYGKTARSFYVPRSVAVLDAGGNGRHLRAAAATGYHPIARPKQFDYLYHANDEQAAKAMRDVAAMQQKSDVLLARRRQLEAEQSALWATIAFEIIQNREIPYQPLYRFKLQSDKSATTQPASDSQRGLLEAMIEFLRDADHTSADADDNVSEHQEAALNDLKQSIETNHAALKEAAFADLPAIQVRDADMQQVKDLLAVAKRMTELTKNITDAYHLALDGDAAGDESRKQTFRAPLQESLLGFADATAELDDGIGALATHWVIHPQPGVPAAPVAVPSAAVQSISPGQIRINGTADHPAMLHNITFSQSLWGSFNAQFAIFDNCKFRKVGAWYDNGGYSSKWVIDKCLIRGPNSFGALTHVDYGVKFTDCTFEGVVLKSIGPSGSKGTPMDYMKSFRKGWRTINNCQFNHCTIGPTLFWCAVNSNYNQCRFPAGSAFESDTPTTVVAFVTSTEGDSPDKIAAVNPPKRAALSIAYSTQPFEVFAFPGSK